LRPDQRVLQRPPAGDEMVRVAALIEPGMLIEIEADAIL
jgi:hypothetical protein